MSSSLLFLGPFKMTSSSLTGSALSGKLSIAILAQGISTLPLKSKSFGDALTTTFGLTFNFAMDGISTLKLSACALTSAVQLSKMCIRDRLAYADAIAKGVNTAKIAAREGIEGTRAVSYTHLDVYKRQGLCSGP